MKGEITDVRNLYNSHLQSHADYYGSTGGAYKLLKLSANVSKLINKHFMSLSEEVREKIGEYGSKMKSAAFCLLVPDLFYTCNEVFRSFKEREGCFLITQNIVNLVGDVLIFPVFLSTMGIKKLKEKTLDGFVSISEQASLLSDVMDIVKVSKKWIAHREEGCYESFPQRQGYMRNYLLLCSAKLIASIVSSVFTLYLIQAGIEYSLVDLGFSLCSNVLSIWTGTHKKRYEKILFDTAA